MAEGVRKRGKSWSYYFDTAKINGERKKIEKGGFRTQKEALEARAAAIAEYIILADLLHLKKSVWPITWTTGLKMLFGKILTMDIPTTPIEITKLK